MSVTPYEDLLRDVLNNGVHKESRTEIDTLSVFGRQIRYDLSQGFPLLTSKKLPFGVIAKELFWFLSGSTNIRPLLQQGVHIWSEWPFKTYLEGADLTIPEQDSPEWKELLKRFEDEIVRDEEFAEIWGDVGPFYGSQWRKWGDGHEEGIDQITQVVEAIRSNPDSRRLIVSAWNVEFIDQMALPPCHAYFQFYVANGKLSCQLYQRSADMFLGVPFNIACYALLIHMVAQQVDLEVGEFIWTGGDTHLYVNHLEQADLLLSREVRPLPQLVIKNKPASLFDYTLEDFEVVGYNPHPTIKASVAV